MSNQHYIFVDESGDPGKPFEIDTNGNKIPTGASLFYILTAIYLDSVKLFALENEILEIRHKYGFRSEIKSTIIPLEMYEDLLEIINKIRISVYYRLIKVLMTTKLSMTAELRHPALCAGSNWHRMFVSRWRPTGSNALWCRS